MSPVRDTAEQRLERVLYILAAAHREQGVSLAELVRALGVDEAVILRDLEEVTAREFYHPAGTVEAFTVSVEADRVRVWTAGGFDRPVRLSRAEALAVQLGLRVLAAECSDPQRRHLTDLAARLERELSVPEIATVHKLRETVADAAPRRVTAERGAAGRGPGASDVDYDRQEEQELLVRLGDDTLRGLFWSAIETRRLCTLLYLKPASRAPETRRVAPLHLVYEHGRWYLLAHDLERCAERLFRIDRVLDAAITDEPAPPVSASQALALIREHSAAYLADDDVEVTVRYTPAIGRWIAERAGTEPGPDGSIVLQHRVADPQWLVQHVLQYGGEAWIEAPESLRRVVAAAAAALSG